MTAVEDIPNLDSNADLSQEMTRCDISVYHRQGMEHQSIAYSWIGLYVCHTRRPLAQYAN